MNNSWKMCYVYQANSIDNFNEYEPLHLLISDTFEIKLSSGLVTWYIIDFSQNR